MGGEKDNSLSNILSLLDRVTGTKGTSTTTSTGGKEVSQDAINAIVRRQLEGIQGLAAISGAEKAAGLYNSSVQTQLVNDLLSRTAGEAAAQSTKETKTSTTQENKPSTVNPLLGIAGMALLDKENRAKAASLISDLAGALGSTAGKVAGPVTSLEGFMGNAPDVFASVAPTVENLFPMSSVEIIPNYLDQISNVSSFIPAAGAATTVADAATTAAETGGGFLDWITGWFK